MCAEIPIPDSWSKKRKERAIRGEEWPVTTPDLKNILWLAEDALKMVVYKDDKLICKHNNIKRYSVQPKIVITVAPINGGAQP
jgi:Holliday junction resolvase RusA-like endonuclease